ncbi:MAG: YkgJ family cysteine cluster protein [Planctomycetes bacterium]|nr:YkgJ family cysteine cluster protein [Planctomycetota bacterium]
MSRARIAAEYQSALGAVDRWFGRCIGCFRDQLRCGRGCTECCHGLFDIGALDALLLEDGLAALPAKERVDVEARGRDIAGHLLAVLPAVRASGRLDAATEEAVDAAFEQVGPVPCPFLGPEGECRAYAHRPAVCRMQGAPVIDVADGPVHEEHCRLNFPTLDPLAPAHARRLAFDYRAFQAAEAGLLARLEQDVGEPGLAELQTTIPFVVAGVGAGAWGSPRRMRSDRRDKS